MPEGFAPEAEAGDLLFAGFLLFDDTMFGAFAATVGAFLETFSCGVSDAFTSVRGGTGLAG